MKEKKLNKNDDGNENKRTNTQTDRQIVGIQRQTNEAKIKQKIRESEQ